MQVIAKDASVCRGDLLLDILLAQTLGLAALIGLRVTVLHFEDVEVLCVVEDTVERSSLVLMVGASWDRQLGVETKPARSKWKAGRCRPAKETKTCTPGSTFPHLKTVSPKGYFDK